MIPKSLFPLLPGGSAKVKPKIFVLFLIFLLPLIIYSQAPVATPATDAVRLELNNPLERTISGKLRHNYQIALSPNQYAKVIIEQHGIDIVGRLLTADGKVLTNNDSDPRREGQETVELIAKDAAVLTLTVSAKQNDAAAGNYKIRIAEIRAATEQDFDLDEARKLSFEAESLWRSEKYKEALPLAQRALAIREKTLGTEGVDFATSLVTLANITGDDGDYAVSETLYKRALAIKEKLLGKDNLAVSTILNNLGLLYKEQGNYVAAEENLQRVLEIREKFLEPNHLLIASVLTNLAIINDIRGDSAQAAEFYRRALEIREQALPPDSPEIAISLMNLAPFYSDFAAAESLYLRALAIQEKILGTDSPRTAQTLYNLARLYTINGDNKAEPTVRRALSIFEKSLGAEHLETSYSLNLLAAILKDKGDYAQSEPLFLRAIAVKEKILGANHPNLSDAYSNLADLYALEGKNDQAISMRKRANDILEFNTELNLKIGSERQKLAYLETLNDFVNLTVRFNFQYAPASEKAANLGAEIILRRKGRVLDAMGDNINALRRRANTEDKLLLDDLEKTNKQISELVTNGAGSETVAEQQAKIKPLLNARDALEDKISRRANGFYEKTQPVTVAEIQPLIQTGSALIEFTVYNALLKETGSNKISQKNFEPHYAVYVLQSSGAVQARDLGDAKVIDKAIAEFRQALRDPKRTDVKSLARTLDEKLMQPVRAIIAGDATHLLISPDGQLNLIPFEAMVDEKDQYLIENYSFTYLTSGRDLLRMQKARESNNRSLIIANPLFGELSSAVNQTDKLSAGNNQDQSSAPPRSFSDTYFAPLGSTIQEGRAIQTLFPDAGFLTGAQATESALKQVSTPRILHIATHGFFLEDAEASENDSKSLTRETDNRTPTKIENPLLRSGIALAGANQHNTGAGDDGILTALEASGLNLWGTKLVVLSACDTGLGEVKNGEGIYGLRRAFVLAGAESLVMSLWSVSDYATRELMKDYYKNLKLGMGRGAALRAVQLKMLEQKDEQHPFYWAAFIQSGEWSNLDGKQ